MLLLAEKALPTWRPRSRQGRFSTAGLGPDGERQRVALSPGQLPQSGGFWRARWQGRPRGRRPSAMSPGARSSSPRGPWTGFASNWLPVLWTTATSWSAWVRPWSFGSLSRVGPTNRPICGGSLTSPRVRRWWAERATLEGLWADWVDRVVRPVEYEGREPGVSSLGPGEVPLWSPWARGERVPFHDGLLRIGLTGADLSQGPGALRRAALEATGFVVRHIVELASACGTGPKRFVVSGGGSAADRLATGHSRRARRGCPPRGRGRGSGPGCCLPGEDGAWPRDFDRRCSSMGEMVRAGGTITRLGRGRGRALPALAERVAVPMTGGPARGPTRYGGGFRRPGSCSQARASRT